MCGLRGPVADVCLSFRNESSRRVKEGATARPCLDLGAPPAATAGALSEHVAACDWWVVVAAGPSLSSASPC